MWQKTKIEYNRLRKKENPIFTIQICDDVEISTTNDQLYALILVMV